MAGARRWFLGNWRWPLPAHYSLCASQQNGQRWGQKGLWPLVVRSRRSHGGPARPQRHAPAYGLAPEPSWGALPCPQWGRATAERNPDIWTAQPRGRQGHQTLTHSTNVYQAPTACSEGALSLSVQVSQLLAFCLCGRAGHPEQLCLSGGQGRRGSGQASVGRPGSGLLAGELWPLRSWCR